METGRQPARAEVALLAGDPLVTEQLTRLAAAAGAPLRVVAEVGLLRADWDRWPVVLVAADRGGDLGAAALPRRDGVVLVGADLDDAAIWQRAVAAGAEHVAVLPDAEQWLVDLLADAAYLDPAGAPAGRCVGVLAGRGGAGATVLACALALTGLRRGMRTTLVDADPLGGGIDLVLGAEDRPGLRWPDLAAARGRLPAGSLADALPTVGELVVLSFDRDASDRDGDTAVPVAAMAALMDAAARSSDLVVIDLPRRLDDSARWALARCERALLVVPAEVRACAAAARVAAAAARTCARVEVVVRTPGPARLRAGTVAGSLGLPLAAVYRSEAALPAALERGEPPARGGRGSLARACVRLLGPAGAAA